MRVKIRTFGGPQVVALVKWSPLWGVCGERPLVVNTWPEGSMLYYGSGRAEVVVSSVPITLRLPVAVVGGWVRLSWPASSRSDDVMALRKIVAAAAGPGAGALEITDAGTWPCLVEYLTVASYPDGSPRQVSSLIIVADRSTWRGCVADKDNDRTLWRSASTLEGLLLELEQALAADDPASWRQAGGGFKNRRKRS